MTTDNTQAISNAVSKPSAVSIEGESVTNRPISEMIAGDKYAKANDALANIAAGQYPFMGFKIQPPGAGDDC